MTLTWAVISTTTIDAESPLTETLMTSFENRDKANSVKPTPIEYAEQSTTAGSGSPLTLISRDIYLPNDGELFIFACEVKNTTNETGTVEVKVGTSIASVISITAGDTAYVFKSGSVILIPGELGSRVNLIVKMWRDTGASLVYSRALGTISRFSQTS
jgi:hypothetical protein